MKRLRVLGNSPGGSYADFNCNPLIALILMLILSQPLRAASAGALAPAPSRGQMLVGRRTLPFNVGWRFLRRDVADGAQPDLNDTDWGTITLPHSFNASDGEQPDYYRGPAWYRRAFDLAEPNPSRRLFIQFGAAATAADVYLNGRRIGGHRGGHAAFRLDLTPALRPGRNLLAVRVSNAPDPAITPLGGDFTLFGGLYRDVALIETGLVHVDLMDRGGPGVYARVDQLTPRSARVAVRVRVTNDGDSAEEVPVEVGVRNAVRTIVARGSARVKVAAHDTAETTVPVTIVAPHRWDGVRDPYLYTVEVDVDHGCDGVRVPLGLREARIDPARGMILNGRPYPLHGVNLMHSARPGRGTAIGNREIDEDFAIIGEMGATGVRLVHFQHPEEAYAAADRMGLVAWTEVGINSKIAGTNAFKANAVEQMEELIAQTYNHPAVLFWGTGNEVYDSDAGVLDTLSAINSAVKKMDASRPTVYAHCCQADDAPKARLTDVIGFNRYFGWYPDQIGALGGWASRFHAAHPERAFAVSEYGAGASIRHQEDPPRTVVPSSGWHPEQYQALYHERNWRELRSRPYIFGSFVWVAFDLASGQRNEGDRRGINDKGLVTYDRRTRKDAWYWYQANWSKKPMLHLTSKRFRTRTSPAAEVKAYTNGGATRLIVNGRPLSSQAPHDHILRWRVTLTPGENHIVVAQRSGRTWLRDETTWIYSAAPMMLAEQK